MKVNLIAIGKKMPSWVVEGYHGYSERLPKEFKLNLIELPAKKRLKQSNIAQLLEEEGKQLLNAVPAHNKIIALDREGKLYATQQLAQQFTEFYQQSQDVSLLIGGPEGISRDCLNKADAIWSLSALTLAHPLVRVLIAEQIYRAFSILTHHPYHR